MSEIQTRIESWQKHEISGGQLLRDFVGYDKWVVPISEKAMIEALSNNTTPAISYNRNSQGEDSFYVFSDGEMFDLYRKGVGDTNSHYLEVQGSWLFGIPLNDFTYFNINPYTPHAVYYGREQFQMLNDTAAAVLMERKLKSLRYGEITGDALAQCLSEIKNYPNFYMILESANGRTEPVLAPDGKNRRLLAAFTAQDNANIFYDELAVLSPLADYALAPARGDLIAQSLLKFGCEGIVFNCRGYAEPIAFTPQFADFILNAG